MVRPNKLSISKLAAFAKAVARQTSDRKWHGQISFATGLPRSLVDEGGNRSVCVFEDPMMEEGNIPANPAHVLLVAASHPMTEEDAKEVRAQLVKSGVVKLEI